MERQKARPKPCLSCHSERSEESLFPEGAPSFAFSSATTGWAAPRFAVLEAWAPPTCGAGAVILHSGELQGSFVAKSASQDDKRSEFGYEEGTAEAVPILVIPSAPRNPYSRQHSLGRDPLLRAGFRLRMKSAEPTSCSAQDDKRSEFGTTKARSKPCLKADSSLRSE